MTKDDIDRLITSCSEESRFLDYKQELPKRDDNGKREFLKDVTALANTAGGCLYYGIEEERDANDKPTGRPQRAIGVELDNFDDLKLRLNQWLTDSCDPSLYGLILERVDGFDKGPVVICQVPQSWRAPHMVRVKGERSFYLRTSAGNQPMDYQELKRAFLMSDAIGQRMSEFRSARVGKVMADQGAVPLKGQVRCICHILPLQSFASDFQLDLHSLRGQDNQLSWFDGYQLGLPLYNFDGLLGVYTTTAQSHEGYVQVFRNGCVEGVRTYKINEGLGQHRIPGKAWEKDVVGFFASNIRRLTTIGMVHPVFLAISFTGVRGSLFTEQRDPYNPSRPIAEDTLLLPEVQIERDVLSAIELRAALSPAIDTAWQSAGMPRSQYVNASGEWTINVQGEPWA